MSTMMLTAKKCAPEDIADLWDQFKKDPSRKELRNALIENYLPLVKYNGERIWQRLPDGVELDDLISAGVFGLMDAIDKYDPTRDNKFKTYAEFRIRGAILDELRSMDWVPRLVRHRTARFESTRQQIEMETGMPASDDEVAAKLGVEGEAAEALGGVAVDQGDGEAGAQGFQGGDDAGEAAAGDDDVAGGGGVRHGWAPGGGGPRLVDLRSWRVLDVAGCRAGRLSGSGHMCS